jgi:hypothetical protein
MSTLSIAVYFPFDRVRIASQSVAAQADLAVIDVVPDGRFRPVCHICGRAAGPTHQREVRAVRDLNLASARVSLRCTYRKVWCQHCGQIPESCVILAGSEQGGEARRYGVLQCHYMSQPRLNPPPVAGGQLLGPGHQTARSRRWRRGRRGTDSTGFDPKFAPYGSGGTAAGRLGAVSEALSATLSSPWQPSRERLRCRSGSWR